MTVIDKYLNGVEELQRLELQKIRKIINQTVPDLEEAISYGIPTLKYRGKNLIHFAAFKDHMSLFPGAKPIEIFKKQLKDFKLAKGTIRFTVEKPIPEKILISIIKYRLREINSDNTHKSNSK